ncbi:ankyrin repeat domain-containing protein [Massilia sp. P8910]|uniref:ankyrin repeat domain-containing protein n=1 Tax=Massilia antarctica TaxID=2765360 RepID=UPI001E45B786|nr:ankyrin repeat domain-containing protein [Massilia antarctica]MCE3604356.1 ankyrin repeat domain-containing protein [Massilia antarctica]
MIPSPDRHGNPPPQRQLKAPMALPSYPVLARFLGASLIVLSGTTADAAPKPKPRKAAPAAVADCHCQPIGRTYTATPTPDVIALWAAARAGDEAAFLSVLPRIARLADYAVDNRPILQALLWSAAAQVGADDAEKTPQAIAQRLAAHRARMPAITRMIAAAIAHGASVTDATSESPRPPLHLAMVFGTPDIVRMLLEAGAPVEGLDRREGSTALEFVLKQEYFMRTTSKTPLVSRTERSAMLLHLFKAGALRPYRRQDAQAKKEGIDRPMADYVAWNSFLAVTEGAEVVRALIKTGTRPVFDLEDGNDPSALAVAAANGDAAAVAVVRTLLPRAAPGKQQWNIELDAAQAAAAAGHMALARSLAARGMPFDQIGPRGFNREVLGFERPEFAKATLLHFAVRAGDAAFVRELVSMGALADGVPAPTGDEMEAGLALPLADALRADSPAMAALLLELGADPLRGRPQILEDALEKGDAAKVELLLGHISPARRAAFAAATPRVAAAWSRSAALNTPQSRPVIKALLAQAGFDARRISAGRLGSFILEGNDVLARELIDGGAAVNCGDCTGPDDVQTPSDPGTSTPLTAAIAMRQPDLVTLLLAHGAQVNRVDGAGRLPVQVALRSGQDELLTRLLGAGARLDFGAGGGASAIDLAIGSGKIALVDRIAALSGTSVAAACVASPEAARALLDGSEAYLDALVARGLKFDRPCADKATLLARMYGALLDKHALPLMGEQRASMTRRLARIDATGGAAVRLGEDARSPLQEAIRRRRADLVGILLDNGAKADDAGAWQAVVSRQPAILRLLASHGAPLSAATPAGPSLADHVRCRESASFRAVAALPAASGAAACPVDAAMTAQEQARAATLAGHYYLRGVNEVGAELLLRADGSFDYALSYGATDQAAKGRWRVLADKVVLSSAPGEAGAPFKLVGATLDTAQAGIALRFRYQGKPLEELTVFIPGKDGPLRYEPRAQDGFWVLPGSGKSRVIAVHHDGIPTADWNMIDLPGAANRFDFEVDARMIEDDEGFDVTLDIDGAALRMQREQGAPMQFERQ